MRTKRLTLLIPLTVVLGLLVASTGAASSVSPATASISAAAADDDEVVLPSRVANAIDRAQLSLDSATVAVDSGDAVKSAASFNAVRLGIYRADKAARTQMNAAPPVDDEEGPEPPEEGPEPPEDAPDPEDAESATSPVDSVIAVLTLEQNVATSIAGLFDGKKGASLNGMSSALFAALNARDKLLTTVIGLDPEGAGADYADGMADTVAGYDDEVANLTEALAVDTLSAGGKAVLTAALKQSKATQARVTAAFGGGE